MPDRPDKPQGADERERRRLQEYIFGLEEIKEKAEDMARETGELKRAQELLLAILGATVQGICLVRDGKLAWCNAAMSAIFGQEAEDLLGRSFPSLFADPRICLRVEKSLAAELDPAGMITFDDSVLDVSGRPVPCLISGRLLDEDDPARGVLYSITDITDRKLTEEALNQAHARLEERVAERTMDLARELEERKKAEEALRKSEERYRSFVDNLPDPVVVYDTEGRVTYVNPAFERLFRWQLDELLGRRVDFVPPESLGITREMIDNMFTGQPVRDFETTRFTKDGEILSVTLNCSPFFDRAGNQIGNLVLFRDVTELKRTHDLLKKSEQRHRLILESSADPMVVYDMEGRVVYFNRAFTRVFGWTLEERLGKTMDRFVPQDCWPETRELISKAKRGIRFEARETRRIKKDGEEIPVSISGAAFQDDKGSLEGSIITIRDITQTKKLERQLLQSQKMEALGTLASGVAHEFNNILMTIRGYAQMLIQNSSLDTATSRYLDQIDRSTQRAADLVNTMLSFSRMETGHKQPVNLNEVLSTVDRLLKQTLPPSIRITTDLKPDLPPVLGNSNQLEQVFFNLALNARDAMPQGGEITLSTESCMLDETFCLAHPWASPGAHVRVEAADTGVGIGPEHLGRVFEPFFTTKEPGKGTGLGLTVVYSVINGHQGGVMVDSARDEGSVFTVYLPVQPRPAEPRSRQAETPRGIRRGQGQRILVVEDEKGIREVARECLESLGYRVIEAGQGRQGLELFRAAAESGEPFDLVILDLTMPVMDGRECLAALLEMDPEVRVIVATGHVETRASANGLLVKARDILRKPFDLDTLMTKVANVLEI